jgi:hypothetical protein
MVLLPCIIIINKNKYGHTMDGESHGFSERFRSSVDYIRSVILEKLDKRTKGKKISKAPVPVDCRVAQAVVSSRSERDCATTAEYLQSLHMKALDVRLQKDIAGESFQVIQIAKEEEPTLEQRKAMWKLNITAKMVKGRGKKCGLGRSSQLASLRNISYGIKREADQDHKLNLLHLRGVLSEEARVGQIILAHIHVDSQEGGWSKGCEAEGRYDPRLLDHWMNRPQLHRKWGLQKQAVLRRVYVTKTGGSMRLFYRNEKGKETSFMVRKPRPRIHALCCEFILTFNFHQILSSTKAG